MSDTTMLVDATDTSTGLDNRKLGMWLFLVTETMLFSGLIAGMLEMKRLSPVTANHVLNIPLTAVNTFILIVSSTTVVLALQCIMNGDRRGLRQYLAATIVLGAMFLGIQIYEFSHLISEGFTPSGSLFGGGFFTVTGFHGLHVFIGLVACSWLLWEAFHDRFSSTNYMRVEVFGLYWHFVDIVWIVLFTIIYLI